MTTGIKFAKKAKVTMSMRQQNTDSEESEIASDNDQHISDEEYPVSDDFEEESQNEANADENQPAASKWALTMAKYLRKTADAPILSKATKDVDVERKRKQSKSANQFEVVGQTQEETKEEKPGDLAIAQELLRQRAILKKERQKDILGLRVRPSIGDFERERALKKIATRGTVQLFNAVRQQQRDVNQKLQDAGKLEYKREKVLKNLSKKEFLNVLMNGPRAKSELVDNLVKKEETEYGVKSEDESDDGTESKTTWAALRADFLTGKKSGWDKEDNENSESFAQEQMDGSSDSE
ncbi:RRP15-like protein [Sabethes cyaneus]|uniref:RRP15-like protein n=1 Tax=Sabethes cyaneus TaxID=53552 RepID=UPI00237EE927|nr:RRP15-like protein [Sabethes cyaneus]